MHTSNVVSLGLAVLLALCHSSALAHGPVPSGTTSEASYSTCLSERALARARAGDAQWTAFRSSNVVVPPLLWLASDRSFAMAAMLYWHSANVSRGTNLHLLAPLLFYRCAPQRQTLGSPLFAYRRDAAGVAGFVGLYFFRRDRDARTDALFPFMLHSLDHGRRTLTLLNGYWHRTARGYHAGFIPLLFWGRSGSYRYGGVLPPLVWFGCSPENRTSVVAPFYLRRHESGRVRTGVLPLYFGVRSRGYAHDVVFPVFWRYRGANWRAGLVGQSYWLRDPSVHSFGSFPFYMGRRDRGGRYLDVVLPALFARAGKADERFVWALNTLWSKKQTGAYELDVIPLLVAKRRGSLRSFYSWLAIRIADEQSSTTVVGPAFHHRDRDQASHSGLVPLWFRGKTASQSYQAIPPLLLGWGEQQGRRRVLVGPAYLRTHESGWQGGLLPLYWGDHDRKHYADTIPPLLFSRWGSANDRSVWAINSYWKTHKDGDYQLAILPILWMTRARGSFRLLTPLVLRFADSHATTTVVGPGFRYQHVGGDHSAGFVPVWLHGAIGDRRWHAVPPLLVGFGKSEAELRLVTGPFYLQRSERGWRAGLLPLYLGKRASGEDYDVVPPLLWGRWHDRTRAGWMLGPIYGRKSMHQRAWGIAPLFAQRRDNDGLFRMFTPLVLRSKTESERTTSVLPLAWHRRNADLHRFVSPLVFHYRRSSSHTRRTTVLPLFWQRTSPERTSAVFAPFWWQFERRDEGKRLHILFPLGFQRRTPRERTVLALNTAYTRGTGSNSAAWSFHFFPLLSLSRFNADHFKWQALMGMLGHEHDAQRSRWRALWIWTEPS